MILANGSAQATFFVEASDRKLKSAIKPLQKGIDTIKKFLSYEYVKNGFDDAGFMAQDIQEVIPYAVKKGDDGYLSLNDTAILAYLHKSVNELDKRLSIVNQKLK